MRMQEAALESTYQRIARIIAKQYNVTVEIRGTRAYIDLNTRSIVLPSLDSETLKGVEHMLDGLLDHEVAHAIYTDAAVCKEGAIDPQTHKFWNVLEDARIEKLMGKAYAGCRDNINAANTTLYAKIEREWGALNPHQKLLSALGMCWERGDSVQVYTPDPDIGAMISLLEPEIADGRTVETTQQALDIAKRIMAKLAEPAKQPEEENKNGDKTEAKQPESDSAQADSNGDPAQTDSSQTKEATGSSGNPSNGGDDDNARSNVSADQTQHPAEGKPPLDEAKPGTDPQTGLAKEQAEAIRQAGAKTTYSPNPYNLEGLVNEHIDNWLGWEAKSGVERYRVFSEEHDKEYLYSEKERTQFTEKYAQLKGEVRRYIGTMASQLELALAAKTQTRWVTSEVRSKRYNRKNLGRWLMGADESRIYRGKDEGESLDTAVTMLWDCSGSMGRADRDGTKAALARLAAIAFHESLKAVNIAHEVLGFDTDETRSPQLAALAEEAKKRGEKLDGYSRIDQLNGHHVYVPFGSQDGRALCNITGRAANRDGEAVLWAARRLANRPETRKILIVGSDGRPSGSRHRKAERNYLREVVQRAISAGIEVFGLGIMDDSVSDYYPNWIVVQEASELPRAVMSQLIKHLTVQGMRQNARFTSGATATATP